MPPLRRRVLVTCSCLPLLTTALALGLPARAAGFPGLPLKPGRVPVLSNEEAWKRLPRAEAGANQPLPAWARVLAGSLPHTTAAMLELDYRHRACSPLDSVLRAKLRWVCARANGCAYGEAYAAADLRRAGAGADVLQTLEGDHGGLPEAERAVLAFGRKLTLAAHTVTDAEVARLIERYGARQVVAMVLLVAYANFHDRLVLVLDLPVDAGGPLAPVEVRFAPLPLGTSRAAPRPAADGRLVAVVARPAAEPDWGETDAVRLRKEVDQQRRRQARIPLPEGPSAGPQWGLICRTYQPELAGAWSACSRTFGAEAGQSAVFEASLFWIVTRTQHSFY